MEDQITLSKEYFGPLWKYIEQKEITDIDFNGEKLWVTDIYNQRREVTEPELTPVFLEQFTHRIANKVSKPFNKQNCLLEAETEDLRISIVHETVAVSGRSICIRKAPAYMRMTAKDAIEKQYCSREILMFLANCVETKMNLVFCGEPGVGKTECAKFFSQFIPKKDRVITIEDNLEWHYKKINPGKDCVELRVNAVFDYTAAIKTCLRQNPKWIMLSEARSTEVKSLLECWSTGVRGFTTLHTDDVRKIPDRILNMMEDRLDAQRMENSVYAYVDVGILLRIRKDTQGNAYRYIDQICLFTRENGTNYCTMLVADGKLIANELPHDIEKRMRQEGIRYMFYNRKADQMLSEGSEEVYEKAS